MPKHRKLQTLAKTGLPEPLEARCTLDFQEPTLARSNRRPLPRRHFRRYPPLARTEIDFFWASKGGDLKRNPRSDLDYPRAGIAVLPQDPAEVRVTRIGVDVTEVHTVDDVKELELQL